MSTSAGSEGQVPNGGSNGGQANGAHGNNNNNNNGRGGHGNGNRANFDRNASGARYSRMQPKTSFDLGCDASDFKSVLEGVTTKLIADAKSHAKEFLQALDPEVLELILPEEPEVPDYDKMNEMEQKTAFANWKRASDKWEAKVDAFPNFKAQLFTVCFDKCSVSMQNKIKSLSEFKEANDNKDGFALLKIIQSIVCKMHMNVEIGQAVIDNAARFYAFKQKPGEELQVYLERFMGVIRTMRVGEIDLPTKPMAKAIAASDGRDEDELEDADFDAAHEILCARQFIKSADDAQYGGLKARLENDDTLGKYTRPDTVNDAFNALLRWKDEGSQGRNARNGHRNHQHQMAFAQQDGQQDVAQSRRCGTGPAPEGIVPGIDMCRATDVSASGIIKTSAPITQMVM